MIKVNGEIVNPNKFPDGTFLLNFNPKYFVSDKESEIKIKWYFENNEEIITLIFVTKHLRKLGFKNIYLYMPYIPNARMDRIKNQNEVFTLKYFSDFINDMKYRKVLVLDPHSCVSEALINNICVMTPKGYIKEIIPSIQSKEVPLTIFFPDEGASKRYSDLFPGFNIAFGIKNRDWSTGKINGLEVFGNPEDIKDHNVLIVDDICSKGGTFYYSAKKLKELGAKDIYLFVSHCEPTILEGEIFKSGLIKKVFTTNSIFTPAAQEKAKGMGVSDKMEVYNL